MLYGFSGCAIVPPLLADPIQGMHDMDFFCEKGGARFCSVDRVAAGSDQHPGAEASAEAGASRRPASTAGAGEMRSPLISRAIIKGDPSGMDGGIAEGVQAVSDHADRDVVSDHASPLRMR